MNGWRWLTDTHLTYTTPPTPTQVWDTHMLAANRPVSTIQVNAELKPHLADLYETDAIFDKFECAVSGDGQHLATGTYNNAFQVGWLWIWDG